ncbi:MAG: S28 family serine protease [Bdellovibrionota bacterium]
MKSLFSILLTAFLVFSVSSAAHANIKEQLDAIEGLTATEVIPSPNPRYRVFDIKFMQPEDHFDPENQAVFSQRLVLWHRNSDRPMVLQTSGYSIFSRGLSALASEFDANQIQVEHRFFSESVPSSKNWALDNIEQSAADFHRITVALKSIYTAKWVNTGRSKGGMTSVYFRRFYPNDIDATVAHVAPHSFSLEDERYKTLVSDHIGGEANAFCRENLLESQKVLLKNKDKIVDRVQGDFDLLGSKEIALEHAVIEMPWSYWQYSGPGADCSNVPTPTANVDDHINFLFRNNDPSGYSDSDLEGFVPYYFQAATQLGNPATSLENILDLLDFEETFKIGSYVPKDIPAVYDDALAMRDVSQWLKTESERILFVYGEFDPWTGGAYEDVRAEGDNLRLDVAGKNHGAQFIDLKGEAHALAYQKLRTWLNLPVDEDIMARDRQRAIDGKVPERRLQTLENKEFEFQKSHRMKL